MSPEDMHMATHRRGLNLSRTIAIGDQGLSEASTEAFARRVTCDTSPGASSDESATPSVEPWWMGIDESMARDAVGASMTRHTGLEGPSSLAPVVG